MMVLGIFTSVTYSNQLLSLVLGGIGPLLLLVGAFIVWLESDEWKMQREEKKQETQTNQFQGQQTLREQETESEDVERETREAAKEIKQAVSRDQSNASADQIVANRTVSEVKDALDDRRDLTAQDLLEAEKNNQNRKTLVEYLERQV